MLLNPSQKIWRIHSNDIKKYFTYTAFEKCNQGFIEIPDNASLDYVPIPNKNLENILILKETRNCYKADLPTCYLYDRYFNPKYHKNIPFIFNFCYTTGADFPDTKDTKKYSYLHLKFDKYEFYIAFKNIEESEPVWRLYIYKENDLFFNEKNEESETSKELHKLQEDNSNYILYTDFKECELVKIRNILKDFCLNNIEVSNTP